MNWEAFSLTNVGDQPIGLSKNIHNFCGDLKVMLRGLYENCSVIGIKGSQLPLSLSRILKL
jgi:hypothetical protein